MSDFILEQILKGNFPTYAYMYTLRQFMRINKIAKEEIDEFVRLVSGKHLSLRDIERLAHGYFHGSDNFRAQIKTGNIFWGLEKLKENAAKAGDCSEFEQSMLKDLEILKKYMKRISCKFKDERLKSGSFNALANILLENIFKNSNSFFSEIKEFYDRTR
ncbi:MAG: hypothetical protein HQM08_29090 [Candidatus Riflebacteria bacterium]|nr:hypothetical protein [Candidatus Riflebacteria bacterium]